MSLGVEHGSDILLIASGILQCKKRRKEDGCSRIFVRAERVNTVQQTDALLRRRSTKDKKKIYKAVHSSSVHS